MQFVADLELGGDGALQIMYGIDGRRDLAETTREDLSGYAGASPVRIGNGAFDQRQNDVFGAALDSILLHTRRSERLPRRLWPVVESQARCAASSVRAASLNHERSPNPVGQATPVPPSPQYPPGCLARYCWW
jgi:alpha,alpha-trehalase